MAINIENNSAFKELYNSIKKRYESGGVEDDTLDGDVAECIANMITAIELGKGDEAFCGMFLPKMNRVFDNVLRAPAAIAMVDGTPTLMLNPQLLFILCEGYYDFKCIIQHEIYHLVFKHLIPSRNYPNHDRCNIAMDVSVNQHINLSDNLKQHCWTLTTFNMKFNTTAEAKREFEYYYDLMPDDFNSTDNTLKQMLQDLNDLKDKRKNTSDPSEQEELDKQINDLKEKIKQYLKDNYVIGDTDGVGEGGSSSLSPSEQLTLQELVEETISEAKTRGKVPSSIDGILNDLYFKEPIIPWQREFRNIIGSVPCPYKKTMRVKNRRQPKRADILGRVNDRTVRVFLAIDTSGSVSDECLKYFFNEIFNILKDVKSEVKLIQCDAKVSSVDTINSKNDVAKVVVNGRGGTCFTPVFEYIKNDIPKHERPDVLVYFTDGYGERSIPEELKLHYDILWVLTGLQNTLSVQTPQFINKVRYLNIEGKQYR